MEAVQETGNLIASDKVQGTNVYNAAGDNLGAIHDVMIDKPSGKVAYAIMSFGGFLGMGNQYHPLPWSVLKYDTNLGGYVVHLDKRRWKAPRLTTLVTNRPGAIALTKVRYTTITGSGLIGLCDCSASQPGLSGVFLDPEVVHELRVAPRNGLFGRFEASLPDSACNRARQRRGAIDVSASHWNDLILRAFPRVGRAISPGNQDPTCRAF